MKVYRSLDKFKPVKNAVLTVGVFDGVHFGHREIIRELNRISYEVDGESVLFTFFPHPRIVLEENSDIKLLNTLEEKIELLEKIGLQHLIIYPFTREFSNFSTSKYIEEILVNKIKLKTLVVGYNHRFGKNREGDYNNLIKYSRACGFDIERVQERKNQEVLISSTKARIAVERGEFSLAKKILSYDFYITGRVVGGNKIGHQIGIPTANIHIEDKNKLLPSNGVYAVRVILDDDIFNGMLNIGFNPTVYLESDTNSKVEVHIFDFNRDIYGSNIKVEFIEFIREEKKFPDLESLRCQLLMDKEIVLNKLIHSDRKDKIIL
ncbi:bifunctional riboflavin kinase/FAD synthetase [Ichthyobacterium seriolicida]|uniref:Riboflavin biosynthesis protein n=1 Tax=Ichthyobacterium seriolicida TaxID=242600 RepID=A0A1J1E9H5_9FLAO|nr:bifunctional riboflavin kinase/FAD synthetase [Ichthyobacterium seriolicida]BAV94555.1 riboflavin kinase/FMN adenylyltransferase [Ichthyobacterium seriolicida]